MRLQTITPIRRLAVLAAASLLVTAMPAATAQEPSPAQSLDDARQRLSQLESRITGEEASAQHLQTQLRSLGSQVTREQGRLREVQANLDATRTRIAETKALLEELRDQIRSRARSLYMRGPLDVIGVVLVADTLSEFVQRIAFANRLAKRDAALILDMRARQAELREIETYQEDLEQTQRTTVRRLENQRNTITDVFARQQVVLADLARARAEAMQLIDQLQEQLGPDEVARLRRVAGQGMTVSYGEWARAFLSTLGAPVVRNNLVVVVAWQAAEGTMATWNPLATTKDMPGATVFNSHGVRNYQSMEQGIEASILTLELPNRGYEPILAGLAAAAEPMDTGMAINQSRWCAGCAGGSYVIGIIPAVEKYYEQYAGESP